MNSNKNHTTSGGIGFTGLLTLIFITLKLTGFITWPWIWVLSPIWISFLLFVLAMVVLCLCYGRK